MARDNVHVRLFLPSQAALAFCRDDGDAIQRTSRWFTRNDDEEESLHKHTVKDVTASFYFYGSFFTSYWILDADTGVLVML